MGFAVCHVRRILDPCGLRGGQDGRSRRASSSPCSVHFTAAVKERVILVDGPAKSSPSLVLDDGNHLLTEVILCVSQVIILKIPEAGSVKSVCAALLEDLLFRPAIPSELRLQF